MHTRPHWTGHPSLPAHCILRQHEQRLIRSRSLLLVDGPTPSSVHTQVAQGLFLAMHSSSHLSSFVNLAIEPIPRWLLTCALLCPSLFSSLLAESVESRSRHFDPPLTLLLSPPRSPVEPTTFLLTPHRSVAAPLTLPLSQPSNPSPASIRIAAQLALLLSQLPPPHCSDLIRSVTLPHRLVVSDRSRHFAPHLISVPSSSSIPRAPLLFRHEYSGVV